MGWPTGLSWFRWLIQSRSITGWGLGYPNRATLSVIKDNALAVARIINFCPKDIEARLNHMMVALTPPTISNDLTVFLDLTGQHYRA